MQIGLFGGTYNPVHLGHIQVAREIKDGFSLDRIYIIPSALPPHKEPGNMANAVDRLEMARLAFSGEAGFIVSDVELKRSGPSYTIDTLHYFKSLLPEQARLYWILGLDAFLEINTWMSFKELFKLVPFIVLSRPGEGGGSISCVRERLELFIHNHISGGYTFSEQDRHFSHRTYCPIHCFDVTPIDISSTHIRDALKENRSIQRMVPNIVENYLKHKRLY
jgi:nicotinate-nucleotide adenylyltransferase